jgi:hypothetical protein
MAAERKKLGEMLIEGGLIDPYQLKSALAHQRQWGGRIGANVVKLGFVTEDELVAFLSRTFNLPSVNMHAVKVPAQVIAAVPKDIAKKYGIVPLQVSPDKKYITVAMSDPTNLLALDELTFLVNARVKPVIASDTGVEAAMHHYYDQTARMEFEPGARPSTEIDFTVIAKGPTKAHKLDMGDKVTVASEDTEDDVVVVDDGDEPQPDFGAMDDAGLDDVLVFTGGSETTISLDKTEAGKAKAAPNAPPPATQGPRTVAPAAKKESAAPSTDQLVMALVRVLIDKGLLTKEELLARLK